MLVDAPCKGCEIRHPGCHSECQKYIEYDTARKDFLEARQKRIKIESDYYHVRKRHKSR